MLRLLFFLLASSPVAAQVISVEEAVDLALEKNYDILVQRALSAAALNDNRYAPGAFLPTLNANGSYIKNTTDSRSITFSNAETVRSGSSNTIQGSLQLQWILFDGSRMFAIRKRIAQLAELADISVKNQMMNSVANVITNYYNIVRQKQQMRALQELIAVNEERVKLAEKKLQVGTGGKPELLQAKVDYNANRMLVLQVELNVQQLKDQLNGQLGMGLPPGFETSDTIPINLDISMEQIMSGIEQTNQALLQAKKNVEISNTILWETRAQRSPVISLVSAYNYTKTENQVAANPFSLQYNRNQGYNYGLSLSLPILNAFNVNRLVSQSKIVIERQNVIYRQQLSIATVGVQNAFAGYENAKKGLQIEEENILLAKENVYIALESFKKGVATSIELRTAQQTLAETYYQLFLARYNAKAAETELLRLKGDLLK